MPSRNLRRDLAVNLTLSLVSALVMMFTLREAARILTPVALGVLLLARRFADLWANLIQAGTPHALRRYLALAREQAEQRQWLIASLLLSGGVAVTFMVVTMAGRRWWAPLTLGQQPEGTTLLLWTALLAVATAGTNLAMSALIAFRRLVLTNLLQIINGSIWLLAALWWLPAARTANALVMVQAAGGLLAVTLVMGALLSGTRGRDSSSPRGIAEYLRETAGYGVTRTVSPFLEILLLVTGPWLLRGEPEASGALILAFTLLRLTTVIVQPLAIVGSVTGAQLAGARNDAGLAKGINLVVGTAIGVGLLLSASGYPWLHTGLQVWLGATGTVPMVQGFAASVLVALVPYLLFQGLKPVIEAVWRTPWVMYMLVVCLVLLLAGYGVLHRFLPADTSVMILIPAVLTVSGLGTLFVVRHLLRPFAWFGWVRIGIVALLIWLLNSAVARACAGLPLLPRGMAAFGAISITLAVGTIALLTVFPSPCMIEVSRFLLPRPVPQTPAQGPGAA